MGEGIANTRNNISLGYLELGIRYVHQDGQLKIQEREGIRGHKHDRKSMSQKASHHRPQMTQ